MSKKQKRNTSHGTQPVKRPAVTPSVTAQRETGSVKPAATSFTGTESNGRLASAGTRTRLGRFAAVQEFNPDYSYVKSDLKRIAILAASFFSVLIILSFILK